MIVTGVRAFKTFVDIDTRRRAVERVCTGAAPLPPRVAHTRIASSCLDTRRMLVAVIVLAVDATFFDIDTVYTIEKRIRPNI
jgi:hypothetical protein